MQDMNMAVTKHGANILQRSNNAAATGGLDKSAGATISWEELQQHNDFPRDVWIAIDGQCYDVSTWIKHHPGGELVLRHSAGNDATEAFLAFHRQDKVRLTHYTMLLAMPVGA
eukprot:jgi/Chrzof1/14128/Cz08g26040.t1